MIARTWRGVTRAEDRDAYLEYLRRTGLAAYASTEGNRGALILARTEKDRAEFLLLSLWDSEDAVRAFAGEEPQRAVFYPEDDRFLVEKDTAVGHYQVLEGSASDRGPIRGSATAKPPERVSAMHDAAGNRHARGWRIAGFR